MKHVHSNVILNTSHNKKNINELVRKSNGQLPNKMAGTASFDVATMKLIKQIDN